MNALSLSHNAVRHAPVETPAMRGIECRSAAAPGASTGGPRLPRRSKEDVAVATRWPREVSASCAAADKRDIHVLPSFEDVASQDPYTCPRGQDPCQESLRHQGMALRSRGHIDSP
jgi:hypothetical protein